MKNVNLKTVTTTVPATIFFLSGFAGLIYEAVWTDYLKLVTGHAAYAQSFVLVVYMGGMAAGAWIISSVGRRIKNYLLWYAGAEFLLGISALQFHHVFVWYQDISFTVLLPLLKTPLLINGYRLTSGALLILPQSVLLGATFPLMCGALLRKNHDTPGYTISLLYFVNSMGAAAGVLFCGFYLVEKTGLPGAIQYAGRMDVLLAAGAVVLGLLYKGDLKNRVVTPSEHSPKLLFKTEALLYAVCFFTAVSSFMYEIGWIRMLSLVLGSSSHSFELMLSAFILGLAVGGFLIRTRIDRLRNPVQVLAVIQVIMGVLAIATLAFYGHLFYLMQFIITSLSKTPQGYIFFKISSHLICLVVMLPATVCAGMTLPMLTQYLYKSNADDSVVGKVYAFNTLGSIAGVITAVHVVIVAVGIKGLLITGGIIDMLAGLALYRHFFGKKDMTGFIAMAAGVAAVSVCSIAFVKIDPVLLSSGVFRFGKIDTDREMIYFKDGKTSTVSVHEELDSYYLSNNGKVDATTGSDTASAQPDEQTQILLGAYPLAYSPDKKQVAMIGLGSGMTASVVLKDTSVQSLEVVEIEPCIRDAARLMGPKVQNVFSDGRCRIITEDAKAYFSGNGKRYGIIISEPSNPWVSGVSGLFSREFFHAVKNYLEDDGVLVQWLHTYEMSIDLLASIFKALGEEYGDYSVFYTASDLVILASKGKIGERPCNDLFKIGALAADLRMIGFDGTEELALGYAGSKASLQYLFNSFRIRANSDYFPVLDRNSEMARFLEARADALTEMGNGVIPVVNILEKYSFALSDHADERDDARSYSLINLQRLDRAEQVLAYIEKTDPEKRSMTEASSGDAARLIVDKIRVYAQCGTAGLQEQVPEQLQKLVEMTVPYLSQQAMESLWTFTENMLDTAHAHPAQVDYFRFLKLVNTGNYRDAKELGTGILGNGRIGSSLSTRIVLTGTVLSMTMLHDNEGIRDIRRRVTWNFSRDLNLRLLFQKAGVYYRSDL